ncbi:MAG: hypothetical protein OQL06_02750 [Gammaproteobacteria bacterium]|nr:hypothetical protein [Gammaproteobacteria bacterium]
MSLKEVTYQDYSACCADFINGIECIRWNLIPQAVKSFQLAYESVGQYDIYHNKYASFCGYARVLNNDRGGLELCRDVARNEIHDGDVLLNLARVEWHYRNRKKAVMALQQGLKIDNRHPGLGRMREKIGYRSRQPLSFLPRQHSLNNMIGKLFRKEVS